MALAPWGHVAPVEGTVTDNLPDSLVLGQDQLDGLPTVAKNRTKPGIPTNQGFGSVHKRLVGYPCITIYRRCQGTSRMVQTILK